MLYCIHFFYCYDVEITVLFRLDSFLHFPMMPLSKCWFELLKPFCWNLHVFFTSSICHAVNFVLIYNESERATGNNNRLRFWEGCRSRRCQTESVTLNAANLTVSDTMETSVTTRVPPPSSPNNGSLWAARKTSETCVECWNVCSLRAAQVIRIRFYNSGLESSWCDCISSVGPAIFKTLELNNLTLYMQVFPICNSQDVYMHVKTSILLR